MAVPDGEGPGGNGVTAADELRAAADRIDALAAAATPGPWSKHRSNSPAVSALAADQADRRYLDDRDELVTVARVQTWEPGGRFVRKRSGADLAWIAALSPAVAPALSALLRAAADASSSYGDLDGAMGQIMRGDADFIDTALAVARALLAAPTQEI